MAQPSAELADLIKAARARGYQIVRTNDGNGWLVTTGALKRRPKFESPWRLATDADLDRLLTRILHTKVGTGYPQATPSREPERPAVTADRDERVWTKRRRGTPGCSSCPGARGDNRGEMMNQSTEAEIEQVLADEADPDRVMIERARSYLTCLDPEYAADLRRHEQEWSRHYRAVPNTDPGQVLVNFWRSGDGEVWFDHQKIQAWCVPIVPGTNGPIPIPMVPLELSALFCHVLAVADLNYGRQQDELGSGLYAVEGNVRFTFLSRRGLYLFGLEDAENFARRLLSSPDPGDPEPPKPGADLPPRQGEERKAA